MGSVFSTASYGKWLSPAAPTSAGSATYSFVGVVSDTLAALWQNDAGTNSAAGAYKAFVTADVTHTGATAAFDYNLTVYGLNTLPTGAFTFADYMKTAVPVFPTRRYTRASAGVGVGAESEPNLYKYYLFVISSTTVAPGGNVVMGLRMWTPGDTV